MSKRKENPTQDAAFFHDRMLETACELIDNCKKQRGLSVHDRMPKGAMENALSFLKSVRPVLTKSPNRNMVNYYYTNRRPPLRNIINTTKDDIITNQSSVTMSDFDDGTNETNEQTVSVVAGRPKGSTNDAKREKNLRQEE